ncbi:hypothetical protein N7462_008286 [Penicillium macrosclerotiorum]|uniref:uncharacterized protein n=1 Tax=Penicillium macrosclerotiorum TaxID=303699 RepID=UPI0025492880|nr:uncharacterized protein N7462_008286 [Penicillium macrosclerotiorum]KAJ5675389.1 hypothetical protein N7462_008286 [Penicillium macrosclerotiorum]
MKVLSLAMAFGFAALAAAGFGDPCVSDNPWMKSDDFKYAVLTGRDLDSVLANWDGLEKQSDKFEYVVLTKMDVDRIFEYAVLTEMDLDRVRMDVNSLANWDGLLTEMDVDREMDVDSPDDSEYVVLTEMVVGMLTEMDVDRVNPTNVDRVADWDGREQTIVSDEPKLKSDDFEYAVLTEMDINRLDEFEYAVLTEMDVDRSVFEYVVLTEMDVDSVRMDVNSLAN